jgi:hypothetical protein
MDRLCLSEYDQAAVIFSFVSGVKEGLHRRLAEAWAHIDQTP